MGLSRDFISAHAAYCAAIHGEEVAMTLCPTSSAGEQTGAPGETSGDASPPTETPLLDTLRHKDS